MSKKANPLKLTALKALLGDDDDFKKVAAVLGVVDEGEAAAEQSGAKAKAKEPVAAAAPVAEPEEGDDDGDEGEEDVDEEGTNDKLYIGDYKPEDFKQVIREVLDETLSAQPPPEADVLTTKAFNEGVAAVLTPVLKSFADALDRINKRLTELEVGKPTGAHVASKSRETEVGTLTGVAEGLGMQAQSANPLVDFFRTGRANGLNGHGDEGEE